MHSGPTNKLILKNVHMISGNYLNQREFPPDRPNESISNLIEMGEERSHLQDLDYCAVALSLAL